MFWRTHLWPHGKAIPTGILMLGLCGTAAAGLWLQANIDTQAQAEFGRHADRVATDISRRYRQPIYGLSGARGMYAANERVTRAQFRAYVEARDLAREFPGVRGFGFIQFVPRDSLQTFTAAQQADGAPDFTVRQLDDKSHKHLYVIKYIDPLAENFQAVGLDIGSEARRRDAAQRAVDTGEATLTAAITLQQDKGKTPGTLLFVPVYRNGTDPTTAKQRRAALVGLLYAPIVIAELLDSLPDVVAGNVNFQLFDAPGGSPVDALVYDTDRVVSLVARERGSSRASRFSSERTLSLPGRDLTLRVSSTAQLEATSASSLPRVVFVSGVLASVLLALLLWQAASGRRRAETLAQRMTLDLDRLAAVARGTSNSVVITDAARRITWVNEGFVRVSGFTQAESIGRSPGALLQCEATDPDTIARMRAALDAGETFNGVILNRGKQGQDYWLELEIQPLRNDDGILTGFMAIESDITERCLAQTRLAAAMRETDALLSALHMHAIISVADRNGNITEVNDAFCRISGHTREALLGQNHRLINSGVHDANFWTGMWSAISAGTPWRSQVCNRSKDGSFYWVDTFIAPFLGADGAIEKYISIRTDITESKNVARDLARERSRLDNIIEGTNVGTWEWNIDTGETRFNERWAQIAGFNLEELGPTTIDTWNRLVHPEDLSRSAALLERHFNDESPNYECETRIRHKNGHWVWVLDRGKLFSRAEDGRPRWMAGTHMDISEQKRIEQELQVQRDFATRIIDSIGQGLAVTNADGYFEFVNPAYARLVGYDASELIGKHINDVTVSEDQARQLERRAERVAGKTSTYEVRLRRLDGALVNVSITAAPREREGPFTGSIALITDLSERIQAEQARREMESSMRRQNELMSTVMENLPCGLSVFDADLRLVAANAEFPRLLDLPGSLFSGHVTRFEDIIRFNAARGEYGTENIEATVQAIIDRAKAPSRPHQFERVRPDGTCLEIRGGPMPAGGFVTTYTDISARREAEADAKRSAQLLRGSIDALDDAFALFDAEDRLVLFNQRYRDMYPLCADMMVPGVTFEALVKAGAERGQYSAAVGRTDEWVAERLALHRQTSSQLVQRLDDGRSLRIVERKMGDGHTVGFRVDITELVSATEAAQEARSVAEAATIAKGQFLANMSHEIRTPMNAILGMLALLRKTELSARQDDYTSKTERAARSLLGLLNDILDFSKSDAGKMTLDPQPFRIDQLLRDLSVILSANLGPKNVEVLFDIDPLLPRLLVGDAMRLQQVLINLSGNAVKFTAKGEVVLSITVVKQHADAVTLEIAVQDTGIGIAPENQARIFSGFTQAEASTTRRFGGSGLGVAISQRLVALMGSELKLESSLGHGSRFYFCITLPLACGAGECRTESGAALPAPVLPLRALIVDDNPHACELLERMCLSLGWSVDIAGSGEQALEVLQARVAAGNNYQAVFVDWQMPGLDGWETSKRIHELGLDGAAPVVVMVTAHGREMLSQRSESEQALLDGFLVKPVTASMLFDAVVDARLAHSHPHPSRRITVVNNRRLHGMRLLVAEDNLNNQQVAREVLEHEGATVVVVNNGQEAVDAVAAAALPFHVVLMDLQMPVMDGFVATSRIRLKLDSSTLPIVAMTANAMASDREACLVAGMNDHVGKPFDLDQLVQALQKQAGWQQTPGRAMVGAEVKLSAKVTEVAALAGVDIVSALNRIDGNIGLYQRMLRMFIKDIAVMPPQLTDFIARGETDSALRMLHTVKGLAATLSVTALADDAADCEAKLATGPEPTEAAVIAQTAGTALGAASPRLEALLAALKAEESGRADSPIASTAFDVDAVLLRLTMIAAHLQQADMAATDEMAVLQRQFGSDLGTQLQPMDEAISSLDFQRALHLCDQLMNNLKKGQPA